MNKLLGIISVKWFFMLVFLPVLTAQNTDCNCNRNRDSLALMEFYFSSNAPWNLDEPMSAWEGIYLNAAGCVESIRIQNPNIGLGIPLAVYRDLRCLKTIDLTPVFDSIPHTVVQLIYFNTTIPPEIKNLQHLEELILPRTRIEGPLPKELGNLPNLKKIDLARGFLPVGSISMEMFIGLSKLEYLDLNRTNLSGIIPASIGELTELRHLDLSSNRLSGAIPVSIGQLPHLKHLNLSSNEGLQGPIPVTIGKLSELEMLDLSNGQLDGPIPAGIGNLTKLKTLNLSRNNLTGLLPETIGQLTKLEELDLSQNNLGGNIPSSISFLDQAVTIRMADNQFTGTIPEEIGLLENLEGLFLSENNLEGAVPVSLENISDWVSLESNNLSSLPQFHPDASFRLMVSNNRLSFDDLVFNSEFWEATSDYSPQKPINLDTLYTFSVCDTPVIVLPFDEGIVNNLYVWTKGDNAIATTKENRLDLRQVFGSLLQYGGQYSCTVTNSTLTALTLSIQGIEVKVSDDVLAPDSIFVESTICWGEGVTIAGVTYDCRQPDRIEQVVDLISGCVQTYVVRLNCEWCTDNSENSVPDIFTPNRDGVNDLFILPFLAGAPQRYSNNELLVFDRFKRKVFSKRGYANNWDGRDDHGQPLPAGTYFFIFKNEGAVLLEGKITIVR